MKKINYALMALTIFYGGSAFANDVTCNLTKFSGGDADLVVSWVGTKFVLDLENNTVQMGDEDGWREPWKISETKATKKFTTYIVHRQARDVRGKAYNNRYAFRVYKDGEGYTQITEAGYRPLKGTGKCS